MAARRGLLLILSAPSGTGKTTLAHRLQAEIDDAVFSVSVTTRAPRGAERDGVDYTFIDPPRFASMIERGELLEWAEVHGNRYGTPRSFADEALLNGRLVIFDIDVQGGRQIKARHPEAASVFVLPPSLSELERRLRNRGTDAPAVVERRLAVARAEIDAGLASYDYALINDDLERASFDLGAIVRSLRGEGSPTEQGRALALRKETQDLRAFTA